MKNLTLDELKQRAKERNLYVEINGKSHLVMMNEPYVYLDIPKRGRKALARIHGLSLTVDAFSGMNCDYTETYTKPLKGYGYVLVGDCQKKKPCKVYAIAKIKEYGGHIISHKEKDGSLWSEEVYEDMVYSNATDIIALPYEMSLQKKNQVQGR